jgi:hypothetical protein
MSKGEYVMSVNNKRLWNFYNTNTNISFEAVNLIFMDLIEKINNDMSSTMTNAINNEILSCVKDIKGNVGAITNTLIVKFHEINKEYIDNMKLIISSSSSDNIEKLTGTLEKNTEAFISKINQEFPKTQQIMNDKMKDNLESFQQIIISDIKGQLNTSTNKEDAYKEYIAGIDLKLQTLQQPLYAFISANQEQMVSSLSKLKESSIVSQSNQNKVIEELGEFLNKYRTNSNYKGKSSENNLELVLNKLYPTAEVVNSSSSLKLAGDFILKREGKQQILIENKNYDLAVQKEGVEKFLRDIRAQKCNGIFMSQHSGIQYKPNFFIEIEDSCVLIYLHNVEYSEEKITTAIDIIDKLSDKLNEISLDDADGIVIEKDVMDKINSEFQVFMAHKENMIFNLKEMQKTFLSQFEDLNMPNLSIFLNSRYASIQNQKWSCDICNESFIKKASLASHKKKHKTDKNSTPTNMEEIELCVPITPTVVTEVVSINEPTKKSKKLKSPTNHN